MLYRPTEGNGRVLEAFIGSIQFEFHLSRMTEILDAFAQFRKATVDFLSVRLGSHWMDFHEI